MKGYISDKKIYKDCTSKKRYKDEYHANKVLKECISKGNKGTSELHIYQCNVCGGFHLGHDRNKRKQHPHQVVKTEKVMNARAERMLEKPCEDKKLVTVIKKYSVYPDHVKKLYDDAFKILLTPKEE